MTAELPAAETIETAIEFQTSQWQNGTPCAVSDIVARFQTLSQDNDAMFRVIYNHFLLCGEFGKPFDKQRLQAEFPQVAEQIEIMLDVDEVFCEEGVFSDQGRDNRYESGGGTEQRLPTIPGYEVLRPLGRGGQADVFLARQLNIDRLVAIKVLPRRFDNDAVARRLRSEAQILGRLSDANIVQVLNVEEGASLMYLVMEYVPGYTVDDGERESVFYDLWSRIHDPRHGRRLTADEAVRMLLPVARSLHAAHQAGVIHRDIKPSNMLLTATGKVKLADFGLAKFDSPEHQQTRTEQVVGTAIYMAPEQLESSRDVTVAADVYSFGVTMYECVTRQTPFAAGSPADLMQRIKTSEPQRPLNVEPTVPRDLDSIILKCLEKDALQRYDSAAALADDLQRFLDGEPTDARPIPAVVRGGRWLQRHPLPSTAVALAVLLIGSLFAAGAYALRSEAERANQRARTLEFQVLPLTQQATADRSAGMRQSAAANHLEVLELEDTTSRRAALGRNLEQALVAVGSSSRRVVTTSVDFHRDGRLLLSGSGDDGAIRAWDTETGEQIAKLKAHYKPRDSGDYSSIVQGIAVQPDDPDLFVSVGLDRRLFTWRVHRLGEAPVRITQARSPITLTGASQPLCIDATAADGGRYVVGGHDGQLTLFEANPVRRLRRPIPGHQGEVYVALFVPGTASWISGGKDGVVRFWSPAGKLVAELPVAEHADEPTEVMDAAFSPNAAELAVSTTTGKVLIIDVRQRAITRTITANQGGDRGNKWVYAVRFASNDRLWTSGSDGRINEWSVTRGEQLRTLSGHESSPAGDRGVSRLAVTRDGKRMATVGYDGIRVWDVETGRPLLQAEGQFVAGIAFAVPAATFCRDQDLLFTVGSSLNHRPRVFNTRTLRQIGAGTWLEESEEVDMARSAGALAVSPDGNRLAIGQSNGDVLIWHRSENRMDQIEGVHKPHRETRLLPLQRGSQALAWSPSGERIASWGAGGSIALIDPEQKVVAGQWKAPVAESSGGGAPAVEMVRAGMAPFLYFFDTPLLWTPDGKRLLTCRQDGVVDVWNVAGKKRVSQIPGHREPITSATLSGKDQLFCGYRDGMIIEWDLATGRPVQIRRVASIRVPVVKRPPTEPPGTLRKFESTRVQQYRFLGSAVVGLADSGSGRWLAAALGDGSLAVIDKQTGEVRSRSIGPEDGKTTAAWSRLYFDKNQRLLSMSSDGALREWDFLRWGEWAGQKDHVSFTEGIYTGDYVAAAPDGSEWCAVISDHEIGRWSCAENKLLGKLVPGEGAPKASQYGWLNGKAVLVAITMHGEALVIEPRTGKTIAQYKGPEGDRQLQPLPKADADTPWIRPVEAISTLAVHPTQAIVATPWKAGRVELWSLADGKSIRDAEGKPITIALSPGPRGGKRFIECLAFHPTRPQLAVADEYGNLTLWNTKTGRLEREGMEGPQTPWGLAYSVDGRRLVQTGVEPFLYVWNSATGELETRLPGHQSAETVENTIPALAFSGNGKWLASGGADGTIHLWDAKDLSLQGVFSTISIRDPLLGDDVFNHGPQSLAFSSDSRWLFAGGKHLQPRRYDLRRFAAWLDPKLTPKRRIQHNVRRIISMDINLPGTIIERNRLVAPAK